MNTTEIHDAQEVFELAIGEGVLSSDAAEPTYAGHYMYMYSERLTPKLIRHYLKHQVTRRYLTVDELPW